MIRCKLRCLEVKDRLDCVRVELKPVIAKSPSYPGGSEENAKFWAATPSGEVELWFAPGSCLVTAIGGYVYAELVEDPAGDWEFSALIVRSTSRAPEFVMSYKHERPLRSGSIKLDIENQDAWPAVAAEKVGTRYRVEFVPADAPAPGDSTYP